MKCWQSETQWFVPINSFKVSSVFKRNFRCDCGNTKFDTQCKLAATKDPVNELNKYNQNYTGVYCTCSRPYPDTDHEVKLYGYKVVDRIASFSLWIGDFF